MRKRTFPFPVALSHYSRNPRYKTGETRHLRWRSQRRLRGLRWRSRSRRLRCRVRRRRRSGPDGRQPGQGRPQCPVRGRCPSGPTGQIGPGVSGNELGSTGTITQNQLVVPIISTTDFSSLTRLKRPLWQLSTRQPISLKPPR